MACKDSSLYSAKLVQAFGQESAIYSEFYGMEQIEAYGYQAFEGSLIDSAEVTQMTVEFIGQASGKQAQVRCRAGATCDVLCKGSGCINMEYVCYEGAVCNLSPSECMDTDIFEGITCPDVLFVSSDDDIPDFKLRSYAEKLAEVDLEALPGSAEKKGLQAMSSAVCPTEGQCEGETFHQATSGSCQGVGSCKSAEFDFSHNAGSLRCDGKVSDNVYIYHIIYIEMTSSGFM